LSPADAKGRHHWVYACLFAKKDRANIEDDELKAFRRLADLYAAKSDVEIGKELKEKELVEICHDAQVQERRLRGDPWRRRRHGSGRHDQQGDHARFR
jgi:hypothetical protein